MYLQNSPTSTKPSNRRNKLNSADQSGNAAQPEPRTSYRSRILGIFSVCVLSLGFFMSCSDDSNLTGPAFGPGEQNILVDTLSIDDFSITELKTYTGNLSYFSAGRYDDPLLGEIKSSAFIAPGINSLSASDSLHPGAEVYLLLRTHNFYGDTLSTARFDLHYIEERWRPNDANAETQVVKNPVSLGTIEITAETDSVMFRLPQEWADNYRELFHETENPNENLRNNEFGFALVPRDDTNVIVGFRNATTNVDTLGNRRYSGSRLFVANPPGTGNGDNGNGDNGDDNGNGDNGDNGSETASFGFFDNGDDNGNGNGEFAGRNTFSTRFRGSAFNVELDSEFGVDDENRAAILNTWQRNMRLDLRLEERGFTRQVISRAELLLFDDIDADEQLPENHYRPGSGRLQIYFLDETEREFEIVKLPSFEPQLRENDNSYRVNITDLIKAIQLEQREDADFFITSGNNNGLITPRIITASGARSPKLIITRINPDN